LMRRPTSFLAFCVRILEELLEWSLSCEVDH
jgi:hypothetical protein